MPYPHPLIDSRIVVKVVILTEFALVKDLVNHFATITTKHFFSHPDLCIQAGFPTVVAMNFLFSYNGGGHNR